MAEQEKAVVHKGWLSTVKAPVEELGRESVRIPLKELHHTVPVDQRHVDLLAESIAESTQLSPILIYGVENEIIDGFHRTEALKKLGETHGECSIVDLSYDQFRDARITSAVTHQGVIFPRVVMWANQIFQDTQWAGRIDPSVAFRVEKSTKTPRGRVKFSRASGLHEEELEQLSNWVEDKSRVWGLTADQIANMLKLGEIIAPDVLPKVRDSRVPEFKHEFISRPSVRKIAEAVPDHSLQKAVVDKVLKEGLTESATSDMVDAITKVEDSEAFGRLISTSWQEFVRQRQEGRKALYPKLTEAQQQRQGERLSISMGIGGLREVKAWLPKMNLAAHPDLAETFVQEVKDFADMLGAIYEHPSVRMTEEDRIKQLELEIEELKQENLALRSRIVLHPEESK